MKPGPKPKPRQPLTHEEVAAKKAAKAAYDREYRAKNADKIRAAKQAWGKTDAKKSYDKRWAEENRERSREIKRAWKARNPSADREYYAANAEKRRETERRRNAENPEANRARAAAWKAANPERAKAAYRRCYNESRHLYIARARGRRMKLEKATPAWADHKAIAAIYREAAERGMHVDHVIPLQGKRVSGLHVHTNLQLLSPEENLRKGNRYACE